MHTVGSAALLVVACLVAVPAGAVGDTMEAGKGTAILGGVDEDAPPIPQPRAEEARPSDPDMDPGGQPFDDTLGHDADEHGGGPDALAPGTQVPHPPHVPGEPLQRDGVPTVPSR